MWDELRHYSETRMRKPLTWQDAGDMIDLTPDQATGYCNYIRPIMAERAEDVVTKWLAHHEYELENCPEKVAQREYKNWDRMKAARHKRKTQPTEKTCLECGKTKVIRLFYSGRNKCRACVSAHVQAVKRNKIRE